MFEWLCILCLFLLFCIPKPIHRPDLVPMLSPLPVQGPKEDNEEDKWVWLSGISTWAAPPLYWCLVLRIYPSFILLYFPSPKSDPKGRNFSQNIFWLTLCTFPTVNYGKSCPEGFPPSDCRKFIKYYYRQPEISLSDPQQLSIKNPKNPKNTKNDFFNPPGLL